MDVEKLDLFFVNIVDIIVVKNKKVIVSIN